MFRWAPGMLGRLLFRWLCVLRVSVSLLSGSMGPLRPQGAEIVSHRRLSCASRLCLVPPPTRYAWRASPARWSGPLVGSPFVQDSCPQAPVFDMGPSTAYRGLLPPRTRRPGSPQYRGVVGQSKVTLTLHHRLPDNNVSKAVGPTITEDCIPTECLVPTTPPPLLPGFAYLRIHEEGMCLRGYSRRSKSTRPVEASPTGFRHRSAVCYWVCL